MLNQLLNCGWGETTTDPIRLRLVRTTAAVAYLMILVGVPFLLRAFEWHISLRMITVPTAIALALVALLMLWVFRHFGLATQLVTLAVYVGGAGSILSGGGIGTSTLGWWILVPLLAGLLRGLGSGLGWGALVLASIYGCSLAESVGYPFPDMTPTEHRASQQLLQALGITCAVLILISSYLSQIGYSEQRLADQNQRLLEQVSRAERAEQELTVALDSKTRFLSNMSHEMKTPLNAIVGFSHQLQKRAVEQLDERGRESLDQVQRHAGDMLALVNDLLTLSHLDTTREQASELRPLDLRETLVRAYHESTPLAERYGLRITLDSELSLMVPADGEQVLQVVTSLLRFALASTEGGSVRMALGELSQGALVQVLYTGLLSEEDRLRLFDRYNHLHSKGLREVDMSPLALALAYEHVQRLGGRINVSSDEDSNIVCFNVFLPH